MSNTKKKLLLELQNSYGFSENFIESLQDGLLITDTQGEVLMVNAAACSITGFNKNELLNIKTPFPFWPKKYINEFNQRFKDFQEDHLKREFEAVYKHKKGEEFPVLVFLAAIKNTKSKVIAYLKYFQSIRIESKFYLGTTHFFGGSFFLKNHTNPSGGTPTCQKK